MRRLLFPDLAEEYLAGPTTQCPAFEEGQSFEVTPALEQPSGFCTWAWNDLYKVVVALARGGNFSEDIFKNWMKDDRCMLVCCTDAVRPVVFKVERLEE